MDNQTVTNESAKKPTFAMRLRRLLYHITHSQYSHLAACFLIPAGLMLLIYICRGLHPIADGSVLVLDLNGQYVYFYEALRDFIWGDSSLLYSFSRALGGEFLGIYAYYIASPLSWLVALFPKGRILEALLVIFLLKTGFCGLTFGWYLHKTSRHKSKIQIRIFATMYALCSYAVVQQHNSMWIDAMIWLPVLTYAIEQLIKNGKYKLFVVSLAITVMSNFYIGYMVCIYVALYFFFYYAAHEDNNPLNEKFHLPKSLGRIAGASLLAIGISAVMVLGAYYSLGFGKNEFTSPDWSFFARFSLADLFVKFLPGAYDSVRPSGLPILYCGTLTLLLVPFFYLKKNISVREKLLSTLFIAIFMMSFIINPLDIIWHGFQKPNWLNYRYSFMLCFFILTLAYKAMCGIRRQKATAVFGVGVILVFAVMILEQFEYENFILDEYGLTPGKLPTFRTVWFTVIMVVILCALLYLIIHAKKRGALRRYSLILLLVVCAETFANGMIQTTSLDIDVSYSSYSSYNNYINTVRIIADKVQEMDTSFYRMEKTRMRKTNDNMALGMRGLSCSTSTLNRETIQFLKYMGYTSYSHRSKYMGETPFGDSLLGVKYILSEKSVSETRSDYNENRAIHALMQELYTVYAETDDYVAFENPFALSLAYTVDDAIKEFSFFELDEDGDENVIEVSPFERLNALVTAMLGSDERIEVFIPVTTGNISTKNCSSGYVAGHTKYTPSNTNIGASVTISAQMSTNGYLFFYAPSDYPREVDIKVNGKKFGDFMAQDSNRIKTLGYFGEGDSVSVEMTLASSNFYLKEDESIFYYLDVDCLEQVMSILAEEQYQIEEFTETQFDGTLTTSDAGETVLTTIPYDEGWHVYVDGKEAEIFKAVDALVAFDVASAGEHTLKLVYSPKIVNVGAIISLVSLIVFIALIVTEHLLKKRKTNNKTHVVEAENPANDNANSTERKQH